MIKLIFLGLSFLLFSSAIVFSQDSCPTEKPLRNICGSVSAHDITKDGSTYSYRQKLFDAACTNLQESNEVRLEKIQKMWAKFEDRLVCTSFQFEVQNGNLIKFGANELNDDFISDVVEWKINLNRIDPSDEATVLDYLKNKIERVKGTALEPKLKSYYERLRKAGAKHKSELKSTSYVYQQKGNTVFIRFSRNMIF